MFANANSSSLTSVTMKQKLNFSLRRIQWKSDKQDNCQSELR
jgi:hypothetical protein